MTSAVTVGRVSKSFRQMAVLRDVNAEFEWGTCTSIVGPNGSGKTVLLRCIVGLIRPDSGGIAYDSSLYARGRRYPDRTGVVLDTPGYVAAWTVRENLERLSKVLKRATVADINATIELFDLGPFAATPAKALSLGTRQRLALAQAVFEGQRLLVFDEAFNGLDEDHAAALREIIRAKVLDGCCVIFTSHNTADIDAVSDRVLRIAEGALRPVADRNAT